jgi:hypothetical protein
VSLVTAVAVAERRRLLQTVQPGWRRVLVVWLVTSVAAATASGLVYLGLAWRAGGAH